MVFMHRYNLMMIYIAIRDTSGLSKKSEIQPTNLNFRIFEKNSPNCHLLNFSHPQLQVINYVINTKVK